MEVASDRSYWRDAQLNLLVSKRKMSSRLPTKISLSAVCLLLLVVFPQALFATSTPLLKTILPRGVQRGTEHVLRFSGERLHDAKEVFLYDQGISVLDIKQVDGKQLEVRVSVSEECRLGEHVAQVRTTHGISDYRSFYVGALPNVAEQEPNNTVESAQEVEINQTVNGIIKTEDVDVYVVTANKGQRLSVEIEAIRLGYMIDPFIAILDENNFELAVCDDTALARQDACLSIIIPENGKYFVLVREASYGGDNNSHYRLHVGNFPRPVVAFPAGGKMNSQMDVQFIGDPTGIISRTIDVGSGAGFRGGEFVSDENGITPSPISFRVSDLENVNEVEPNNAWRKLSADSINLPVAINGIIEKDRDRDYFKFNATKGQVFDFECYASRIRSGLDPVMNIFTAKHKSVIGNDDARRPDAYLRFTAPADGEYLLRIRDHLDRGRADFVYRVEASTVKPALQIGIPRVDRYSQQRQQIAVPKGNRFATLINATRTNFGGSLKLIEDNLPDGVTMQAPPMVANLDSMPVVFEAAEDAEITGSLIDLKAHLFDPKKPDAAPSIIGSFQNQAAFALGLPNNALYYGCNVDKLPIAITEPLPFKLEIVEPKVPLVRGGSINLKVVVTRDEGFDRQIRLLFPFRPPGVGTKPNIIVPKGKTEAYYPLNANGKAQIGKWPVYVMGRSDVKGPVWASTQLANLEIAEPFVLVEMKRASCERGSATSIVCKLNHNRKFAGQATAELLGVPPNIAIEPIKFTSETKELVFTVKTNDKSPFGKHKGLFCRITIVENDEPIVAVAGRGELQITKPKKNEAIVKASSKAAVKATDKPAAKPLSRLEQLREQARRRAQKVQAGENE